MTQRVLVTAGASGIGLAIAKTFVADVSNPQAVKHLLEEVKNPSVAPTYS
jgi:short-subunit dehydrogenase involved in D-alanine esterification of teichoic acids